MISNDDELVAFVEGLRRIERRFGVRIALEDLFGRLGTLAALAAHLEASTVR